MPMERGSGRGSKRSGNDRRRGNGHLKTRDSALRGIRGPRLSESDLSRRAMAHAYASTPPLSRYVMPQELPGDYPHYASALHPSDLRLHSDLGYADAGRVVLLNPDPMFVPAPYVPSGAYGVVPGEEYLAPSYMYLRSAPEPSEHFTALAPRRYLSRASPLPLRRGLPSRPVRSERPIRTERKRKLTRRNESEKRKKTVHVKADDAEAVKEVSNPVEGMIFGCNNKTTKVCKKLDLFGLPGVHENEVVRIIPGSKLFLFNYDTKFLSGVFEATSNGAMNIVQDAFGSLGSFPAQVKVKRVMTVPRLSLDKLHEAIPEIFIKGKHKFKYELNAAQVAKLLELFVSTKGKATS